MKGSKRSQQTQNQGKHRTQSFVTLPDQATSGQLPGTSAAVIVVAGLLTPGWHVTVEGDGADTAIGLIAFEKPGIPVMETLVAVVVVAAEAEQIVCCVNSNSEMC